MTRAPRPPRYPLPIPVTLEHPGGRASGDLVDVSATGLLARVRGPLPAGTEVVCDLEVAGHRLALAGTVTRFDGRSPDAQPQEVGVDFGVPDPGLWALLDDLDHGRIPVGGRVARVRFDDARRAPAAVPAPAPAPRTAAVPHLAVDQPFLSYSVPPRGAASPGGPLEGAPSAAGARDGAAPPRRAGPSGERAERRGERRFPVRLLALVDHEKIGGRARVLDLGARGARVALDARLRGLAAPGVHLRFRLNFRELGPVATWARVVWVSDEGDRVEAGLAFTNVADESVEPLARLVDRLERPGGAEAVAAESLIRP